MYFSDSYNFHYGILLEFVALFNIISYTQYRMKNTVVISYY